MKYKMSVSMKIKIGNAMYHFSCNVIVGLHISQSAWCGLVISLAYAGCNTRDMECKHKWHAHMNVCAVGILDSALFIIPSKISIRATARPISSNIFSPTAHKKNRVSPVSEF